MNQRRWMLLVGLMLAGTGQAKAIPDAAVVKLYSHRCASELSPFVGSGALFRFGGGVYAITSEHVVLHSNQGICDEVENAQLGKIPAELVQADWGAGLALLRMKSGVTLPLLPDLEYFRGLLPPANARLTIFGFPFGSQALVKDEGAYVLLPKSRRAFIPLVPEMIEVAGGHVEYGMSGGVVTSDQGEIFVGVISHQALRLVSGHSSEVSDLSEGTPLADDFFVIPSATAFAWARKVLERPQDVPGFVRDPSFQLRTASDVVFSSGVRFSLLHGKTQTGDVGGAGGVGIGGAGGVGIGGGENREELATDFTCAGVQNSAQPFVAISLDTAAHAAQWDFGSRNTWLSSVKAHLLKRGRVCIPYFVQYDLRSHQANRVPFHSLAQFITLLGEENLWPATSLSRPALPGVASRETIEDRLRKSGAALKEKLNVLSVDDEIAASLEAQRLFQQIRLYAELLELSAWQEIGLDWAEGLRGNEYETGWRVAFNSDFSHTVDLMREFLDSLQALKGIRL